MSSVWLASAYSDVAIMCESESPMKKTRDSFKRLIEAHSEARVSRGKLQVRCVGGGSHSQSMAGV
eukprot:scaffold2058_cov69-Phaeocystis_antarctica.AAC.11